MTPLPDADVMGLLEFLRLPSLSTTGEAIKPTADWLCRQAQRLGARAEVMPTAGWPIVAGEFAGPPAAPTILLYGHYDVQPPDPLDLWESDPFDPVLRDGAIYARGATDDKGNLWAALLAAGQAHADGVPLTIRFCFEGEEEVGSPNLLPFLRARRDRMACDACVLCDRGVHESGRGQIFLGNKGMIHLELAARGPRRDVHSSQAPLLPNPAWAIVETLAALRSIEGWRPASTPRPATAIPFDRDEYLATYGVDAIAHAEDPVNALLYEPTFNIQGIGGGYQGPGNKTIIPATAFAKVDLRLVPGQELQDRAEALAAHLRETAAPGVSWQIAATMPPYQAPPDHWVVQAAIAAARAAYDGEPVVWPHVDGSGPLGSFADALGAPAILIGLGSPFATANTHAPNENLGLREFRRGIAMMTGFFGICAGGEGGGSR